MINDAEDEEPTPEQLASARRQEGWSNATWVIVTVVPLALFVAELAGWTM